MSAAWESAASPSPCACTNISLMQLFHELKQKFPGVPDHVVSNTIELYCHDKYACETHLHSEAKASLTHAYHASSSAAAKQLNELKVDAPLRCRNQPLLKQQILLPTAITASACQEPQTATLSDNTLLVNDTEEKIKHELWTDANQNVVEVIKDVEKDVTSISSLPSPITIINLDNCIAKYCTESPSDVELTNDGLKEEPSIKNDADKPEFFKILKSNKIKYNLHERLEKGKEKKITKFQTLQPEPTQVKPKRPNTLEFIKPNPDIAFKPSLQELKAEELKNKCLASTSNSNINEELETNIAESKTNNTESKTNNTESKTNNDEAEANNTKSKTTNSNNNEINSNNNNQQVDPFWQDCYPLNLSVNVNCHMDLSRGYSDPWLEEFETPRAITSLNLTVCTPTSSMASPVRERRDEEGFESHFTVTVSPSSIRPPPRRKAPPPPPVSSPGQTIEGHRMPSRTSLDSIGDRSLIERQKARLNQLAEALKQERSRLHQLRKETSILAAPTDSSSVRHLRAEVTGLREQCDSLVKQMEINVPDTGSFYSNIYTGQRPQEQRVRRPAPPPPGANWQCHMCTFRNHPLLDKCEECDMPRILVVRAADGITVRWMPGRRKLVRSWVL